MGAELNPHCEWPGDPKHKLLCTPAALAVFWKGMSSWLSDIGPQPCFPTENSNYITRKGKKAHITTQKWHYAPTS